MSTYATWLALSGIGLLIGGAILRFWPHGAQHTARHRQTGGRRGRGDASAADQSALAAGGLADQVKASGPADDVEVTA